MDLPPATPPTLWEHPKNGSTYYFGQGDPPPGTTRGSLAEYQRHVRERMEEVQRKMREAEENVLRDREHLADRERAIANVALPLNHKTKGLAAFLELPAEHPTLQHGSPSPYTPGARVATHVEPPAPLSRPRRRQTPMHDAERKPAKPSLETLLRELQEDEEIEELTLVINQLAPKRSMPLEEVDLFARGDKFSSLGKVREYLQERHFDGRAARFVAVLMVDGGEEARWKIELGEDRERLERHEIEHQARMAAWRRQQGLPEPALSGASAPIPVPPGGMFSLEQVQQMMEAAVAKAQAAAAAPAAPAPAAAPEPQKFFTPAEMEEMIRRAVDQAIPKPAPAAAEPPKGPLEQLGDVIGQAKTATKQLDDLRETLGVGDAADPQELTVNKNGMEVPVKMFETDPKTAFMLSNAAMFQGIIGSAFDGLTKGITAVIREGNESRRAEVEIREREVRTKEREMALIRQKQEALERQRQIEAGERREEAPEQEDAPEAPPVVNSEAWAPPRHRKSERHG